MELNDRIPKRWEILYMFAWANKTMQGTSQTVPDMHLESKLGVVLFWSWRPFWDGLNGAQRGRPAILRVPYFEIYCPQQTLALPFDPSKTHFTAVRQMRVRPFFKVPFFGLGQTAFA